MIPFEMFELDDPIPEISLYLLTYKSQGHQVRGLYFHPRISQPQYSMLYCRGGIGRYGMIPIERLALLAARGISIIAPAYRGNWGGEGHEDFGGQDRHDAIAALELIFSLPATRTLPQVILGFSRGSTMALAAAAHPNFTGPVAIWGGVSDLELTYQERVDLRRMLRRIVGHPKRDRQAYLQRSPASTITSSFNNPLLWLHGLNDKNVSPEHGYRMAAACYNKGVSLTLRLYSSESHNMTSLRDAEALDDLLAWYTSQLLLGSNC